MGLRHERTQYPGFFGKVFYVGPDSGLPTIAKQKYGPTPSTFVTSAVPSGR